MESVREEVTELRQRFGARVADAAAVLLSVVGTLAAAWSSPLWVDLPRVVIVGVGIIGTASLWWRRRWPVLVALVGVAVFLLSHNPVPLIYGLYTTAVIRRDRALVGVTAMASLAYAIPEMVDAGRFDIGMLISGIGQAVLVVAVGAYVGARRDLLASLRERAERAEEERELRAEHAKAGERARIAREMHDVLAHKVSLIALHAGALEVNAELGRDRVEEAAALIRTTAHQTLEELREVLGVLRSDAGADGSDLTPTATTADIARLVESSRAAGIAVTLTSDVAPLPDATARAVYRVVQEALTNVHKHARGAATVVSVLGSEDAGVDVAVVNVRPVAADLLVAALPGSGAGLLGLAERTRLLGGSCVSGPEPDGGWGVRAWMPWHGATEVVRT